MTPVTPIQADLIQTLIRGNSEWEGLLKVCPFSTEGRAVVMFFIKGRITY